MKHSLSHSFKMIFVRIGWFLTMVDRAVRFHRKVKDYSFLINTKKRLETRLLALKRVDDISPEIMRIEGQIELINAILTYDRR